MILYRVNPLSQIETTMFIILEIFLPHAGFFENWEYHFDRYSQVLAGAHSVTWYI